MRSKIKNNPCEDPLAIAWAPPKNETPEQREQRGREEEIAKKVSLSIDEEINEARQTMNENRKAVQVLILGQAESGKSTTIKNFQMTYSHESWIRERAGWKVIIYLNLVRSVNKILDVLVEEFDPSSSRSSNAGQAPSKPPPTPTSPRFPPSGAPPYKPSRHQSVTSSFTSQYQNSIQLKLLSLRLVPLRRIQHNLESLIGSGSMEIDTCTSTYASDSRPSSSKGKAAANDGGTAGAPIINGKEEQNGDNGDDGWGLMMKTSPTNQEFCIVSSSGWKTALSRVRSTSDSQPPPPTISPDWKPVREGKSRSGSAGVPGTKKQKRGPSRSGRSKWSTEDIEEVIVSCTQDIRALWADESVRKILTKHDVNLEDQPGFFLNDVARIGRREYEPSDDDIIRARLRTMGVQEYRFCVNSGLCPTSWVLYDVAGIRTSRAAWFPYFDLCTAIIFLAPISAFNETLLEDPSVNRLKDSLSLWKSIVGSKILKDVQIVLLLNKCDLLAKKLRAGLMVKEWIRDFGERENTVQVVTRYFREAFRIPLHDATPDRTFYSYFTSIVDTKASKHTLTAVEDSITRKHFSEVGLW